MYRMNKMGAKMTNTQTSHDYDVLFKNGTRLDRAFCAPNGWSSGCRGQIFGVEGGP